MSRLNIAPTKSNQIVLKRDLAMATNGHQLLEQKREILVMELMRLMERAQQVQRDLDERSARAYATLRRAIAYNGYRQMRNIASGVSYGHKVKAGTRVAAGIRVPAITVQSGEFHSQYGLAGTDSLVDQTMADFLALSEAAGRLAELETAVWLLARELKKTQRRVNALEHIFIPNYKDTLRFIVDQLEGKELDSFFTMKLVKKRLEKASEEDRGESVAEHQETGGQQ
ncbi:MAG: V-type ATP synthase subunit D [Victivallales bacterium]|nr:V-type ATP synthase subunit D [Victivallales bacterium]